MHNFTEMTNEFLARQAAIQLQNPNEIAFIIGQLIASLSTCVRYACAARALADEKRHVLVRILEALDPILKQVSRKKASA
jgi:3-deoxy-D-manno-octulosonic-acid transferase